MILTRLLKPRLISILTAALMALHMTTAIAGKGYPGKKTETDNTINYPALIKGADNASITEDDDSDGDNLLEANGRLRVSDRNSGEAAFLAKTINGSYGNFVISTKGHWYYAAKNSQSIIQNLTSDDTLTDILTVSSNDGTTHDVTITIVGVSNDSIVTNQAAIISGVDTGNVTEDNDPDGNNLLEIANTLNITDSDSGEAAFIAKTHTGKYGHLVIATTGKWSYAADNNQSNIQNLTSSDQLNDSLIVSSVDGTTHTVVITISGVDEPATIETTDETTTTDASTTETTITDASETPTSSTDTNQSAVISGTNTGDVTEDNDPDGDHELETQGKLNITDSDLNEDAFIKSTINSSFSRFTIDTKGYWKYDAYNDLSIIQNLNSGETITDTLNISSIDGTTHTVVITIIGIDESVVTDTTNESATADTSTTETTTTDTSSTETATTDTNSTDTETTDTGTSGTDTTNQASSTVADIDLSWIAPSEREDNSALSLSEIAGYKIYYGTTQGDYRSSVNINDSSSVGHTLVDFPAGTYYFVVTIYDTEGRESSYSTEIKITI